MLCLCFSLLRREKRLILHEFYIKIRPKNRHITYIFQFYYNNRVVSGEAGTIAKYD